MFTFNSLSFRLTDGDEDEENFRGWTLCAHNVGGCQELFRAIWTGKLNTMKQKKWIQELNFTFYMPTKTTKFILGKNSTNAIDKENSFMDFFSVQLCKLCRNSFESIKLASSKNTLFETILEMKQSTMKWINKLPKIMIVEHMDVYDAHQRETFPFHFLFFKLNCVSSIERNSF